MFQNYSLESKIDFLYNKRILITGGGGYLGSKLAEKIVSSHGSIYLCDIEFNTISKTLAKNNSNVKLIELDLTRREKVAEVCAKNNPDFIYHFAAILNRDRDFSIYPNLYDVNVNCTLNLLEALKNIPYSGFYFASSSEVYGLKNSPPFNEKQIPNPISPYSLTKLMAEYLIETYSNIYQKPYTIFRIFNFFGPDMSDNFFINQLITSMKKDEEFKMTCGIQKRDFLYIDDLISIIINLSNSKKKDKEIVNICSGKSTTLKELALEIAKSFNKEYLLRIGELPYRNNEMWDMLGDTEKLKAMGIIIPSMNFIDKLLISLL